MLLGAARGLAGIGEMGVDVRGALFQRMARFFLPLQPLVHIAGLSDVERDPLSVLALAAIDVIARQGRELGVQIIHRVGILGARVARPIDEKRRGGILLLATT